jgi:choline dehydrogenase-like flavoprotein
LSDGDTIRTSVCVIGAGAAGLTIAQRMSHAGLPCVVLEAGGTRPSRPSQSFYWAKRSGAPNHSYAYSRFRALGGSTTFWTGQCVELEEEDFLGRDGAVPAWPFRKSELEAYYRTASDLLQLTPARKVQAALSPDDASRFSGAGFHDVRLSPVQNFAQAASFMDHGATPARIILNAAVTEISPDDTLGRIQSVQVHLPGARRVTCVATVFVLATGGVENARLLLLPNTRAPRGLGNGHDLVGRYFMDHAYMNIGTVAQTSKALQHLRMGSIDGQRDRSSRYVVLRSRSSDANAAALFLSEQPAFALSRRMATPQGHALSHLSQIARVERFAGRDTWPHLVQLARRPDRTAALFAGRLASIIHPAPKCAVRLFCETTPQHESRVRLTNVCDGLGLPRAEVDWRIAEYDKRGPARLLKVLHAALRAQGEALDTVYEVGPGHPWPDSFRGGKHHIGTTRMSDSCRTGVVDATCRVHGLANLYVAGSSVFPSSGWANPTLSIVALALRLSDELCRSIR